MSVSRGKAFEATFKSCVEKCKNVSVDRFPDPSAGYAGIRNVCDFSVYKYPFHYYFECKAFSGNTLNFKADITKDQWNGLLEKSKIPGVVAGVVVWFVDHDITAFVPIQNLQTSRDNGEKSLNVKQLTNNTIEHIELSGHKKRVFFEYDTELFFKQLSKRAWNYWRNYWIGGDE